MTAALATTRIVKSERRLNAEIMGAIPLLSRRCIQGSRRAKRKNELSIQITIVDASRSKVPAEMMAKIQSARAIEDERRDNLEGEVEGFIS